MIEHIASTSDLFFAQAKLRPHNPAIINGSETWTYKELKDHALLMSSTLEQAGLRGSQKIIATLCDKGVNAYASQLAIWHAGCVHLPINPTIPPSAVADLIKAAGAQYIFCENDLSHLLPDHEVTTAVSNCGRPHAGLTLAQLTQIRCSNSYPGMAYLLFTSGSTGKPKGVPITHLSLRYLLDSLSDLGRFTSDDVFSQMSDLSFDLSIAETNLCWRAGACLAVPTQSDFISAANFVRRNGVTVWNSVPTLGRMAMSLRLLKPSSMPSLRFSSFCGEALSTKLAVAWAKAAPNSAVYNLYGPTEGTIYFTYYRVDADAMAADAIVPIGKPLVRHRVAIVDENDMPVADKEIGELLLEGPQLSAGYWNDPAQTSLRFFSPIWDTSQSIWYRTGDRAANVDGNLHFHGRVDRQIKLNGYRIEMEQIEAVLRAEAQTEFVAVVPVTKDGNVIDIAAFIAGSTRTNQEISEGCKAKLPPFAVPQQLSLVDQLPTMLNGKIDYQGLARMIDPKTDISLPSQVK
jgi:D-alanine--poly(phosphoribitol) ligase subunit 1